MTITIGWVTQLNHTTELIIASDSRLRSYGALDQCQKVFPLERGDCCLGFCGDAQIAYPLFIQAATTINNFIKTRTRGTEITQVRRLVGQILDNLISSWDIAQREKADWLKDTRIMFGGWSWMNKRFYLGYFRYDGQKFVFHYQRKRLPHPWREVSSSLVFIGDYEQEYMRCLAEILPVRYPIPSDRASKAPVSLRYEPLQALQKLLNESSISKGLPLIGGVAQMVKIYEFGNSLPFVVKTEKSKHFLFGRELFDWEKTEKPVIDLSQTNLKVAYPMTQIPTTQNFPDDLFKEDEAVNRGDLVSILSPIT